MTDDGETEEKYQNTLRLFSSFLSISTSSLLFFGNRNKKKKMGFACLFLSLFFFGESSLSFKTNNLDNSLSKAATSFSYNIAVLPDGTAHFQEDVGLLTWERVREKNRCDTLEKESSWGAKLLALR